MWDWVSSTFGRNRAPWSCHRHRSCCSPSCVLCYFDFWFRLRSAASASWRRKMTISARDELWFWPKWKNARGAPTFHLRRRPRCSTWWANTLPSLKTNAPTAPPPESRTRYVPDTYRFVFSFFLYAQRNPLCHLKSTNFVRVTQIYSVCCASSKIKMSIWS